MHITGPRKLVHDKEIGSVSPPPLTEQNLPQLIFLVSSIHPLTLVRHGPRKLVHDKEDGTVLPPPLMVPNSQQVLVSSTILATSTLP